MVLNLGRPPTPIPDIGHVWGLWLVTVQSGVGVLLACSGWRPGVLPSVLQYVGQPPREDVIRGMPRQPVALSVGCTCPCFQWFLFIGRQGYLVLFFKEDTWRGAGGTSH